METNTQPKSLPSRSLMISGPGDVRLGPILAIPAVLTELGVRPQCAFAQAGVDPRLFEDPENRMSLEAVGNLLDACVGLTGCPHFGLLVGERFDLNRFGPLGHLLANCATVGHAVRSLVLHLHLHDRGAAPVLLAPERSRVALGYSMYRHGLPAADQIYDAAIAIGYRILSQLCGPRWKPLRVQFSHRRLGSAEPYRRVFRTSVRFDAEVSAIVFASSVLERPIEGADPLLHDSLAKAIQDADTNGTMTFAQQVREVLHQMVLSGTTSAQALAHLFSIHERTLRRHLEAEGTSLRQLVTETRFELAQHLLRNTGIPVAEIAAVLGYDDPNAFSRAFRGWAKVSPTQWRTRQ